jgi:chromosome segregation ATPase
MTTLIDQAHRAQEDEAELVRVRQELGRVRQELAKLESREGEVLARVDEREQTIAAQLRRIREAGLSRPVIVTNMNELQVVIDELDGAA